MLHGEHYSRSSLTGADQCMSIPLSVSLSCSHYQSSFHRRRTEQRRDNVKLARPAAESARNQLHRPPRLDLSRDSGHVNWGGAGAVRGTVTTCRLNSELQDTGRLWGGTARGTDSRTAREARDSSKYFARQVHGDHRNQSITVRVPDPAGISRDMFWARASGSCTIIPANVTIVFRQCVYSKRLNLS